MKKEEIIKRLEDLHKMTNICECDLVIINDVYELLELIKKKGVLK